MKVIKYLLKIGVGRVDQINNRRQPIKTGNHKFENITTFTYLRVKSINKGTIMKSGALIRAIKLEVIYSADKIKLKSFKKI